MAHPILSLKELRDGGYLQEANRKFWHPLGLAMALVYGDGKEAPPTSVEFYDYREDEEGVYFGPAKDQMEASLRLEFAGKIEHERSLKKDKRVELFGQEEQGTDSLIMIQPKPNPPERKSAG